MGRFIFYCASYWHRDCEPSSVAVALVSRRRQIDRDADVATCVSDAIDAAMAEEREHCLSCDCGCGCEGEDTCDACEPDLCWSGVHADSARNLFSAKELLVHRHELLAGEVVWLERG